MLFKGKEEMKQGFVARLLQVGNMEHSAARLSGRGGALGNHGSYPLST